MDVVAQRSNEEIRALEFAKRWYPYGGGDSEDIMTTFGLDDRTFYTRVHLMLRRHPGCFDPSVMTAMIHVAQVRRAAGRRD